MKIRWNRLCVLTLFIASLCLLLHDFYVLSIKPWFSDVNYQWTWFGFATFIIAMIICSESFEQLKGWWENE